LDAIAINAGGGGRFISLLGNHELMNVLHQFHFVSEHSKNIVSLEERAALFTRGSALCESILAKRNVVVKIGSYIFCHAGILPVHLDITGGDLNKLNTLCKKFLRNERLTHDEVHILHKGLFHGSSILWNREYPHLIHSPDVLTLVLSNVLSRTQSTAMFVGHNTFDNIQWDDNNRLFFVDAGFSRSYSTDRIQLLEINSSITQNVTVDSLNVIEIRGQN
jgi:hypothetical protein